MENKSDLKSTLLSILVILSTLFAWSCGGGGDTPSQILKPANLDQCAAETTADILRSFENPLTSTVSDVDRRSVGFRPASFASPGQWAMGRIQDALSAGDIVTEDVIRAGSQSESKACTDGGTSNFSATWTGPEPYPDQYSGLCQISDTTISLTYSDCVESGETKNGSSVWIGSGTACRPAVISMNFNDYRIEDNVSSYFIAYIDFDLEFADLRWEEQGAVPPEPMSYNMTLNGSIETSFNSMEFNRYVVATSSDGSIVTQSGNGEVTGGGIDGWVSVATISPVLRQLNSVCPYEGHIQLSGARGITVDVVYHGDGSMTIGDHHYDTCDAPELMSECP